MRALAVATLLAACGGPSGGTCSQDSQCGGDVCAANGICESSGDVSNVRIQWTVSGQPASATTCSSIPNLDLYFEDGNSADAFGYAPVPCAEGLFTELKLPNVYTDVELFDDASQNLLGDGAIGSNASVSVDLTP